MNTAGQLNDYQLATVRGYSDDQLRALIADAEQRQRDDAGIARYAGERRIRAWWIEAYREELGRREGK